MATATITQLPAADLGAIDDTTVFPVDDANTETRKLTLAEIRDALGTLTIDGDADGTGSPFGVVSITIANGVVTLAKMADMATGKLLGRSTAGAGAPEELSVGTGLALVAGVLSVSAAQNASDASPLHDQRAFGGF